MTVEALCVGDTVCLFSEETFGYVYCVQSSITTLMEKVAADAENEDNVAEQHRQQGKKLLYGQIIQVELLKYNAKHALFKIMPRYKVKAEGDVVVHLRVRPVDQSNPRTLFPSTSAITYWQIELQDEAVNGILTHTHTHTHTQILFFRFDRYFISDPKTCFFLLPGGVVHWEQLCHFRHMCTRKYLKIAGETVTLTDDHMDPKHFLQTSSSHYGDLRLRQVEKDQIEYETYCRIEQVGSNHWLHAELEDYKRNQFQKSDSNEMSMTGLPWTRAPLKKITASQEMQYDDAFTLQEVKEEDLFNFNFMAGMVPGIQKILEDKKAGHMLYIRETNEIIEMLQELQSVLVMNSVPNKNNQKFVRNLQGDIGLNAAHMVMELVKDNRQIVDRIPHKYIDHFVDLLKSNKQELQSNEELLFLDHQLDLFGKLCYGRNEYAINVITEKHGYLKWQEAFCCLKDENLPDQLKAKYCHLIIVLFVDVGANMSVLDRVNLTFVYDYIGEVKKDDEQDIVSLNVLDDVLKRYRETTRYQENPETQAIVDAKYQAMEVVDLFFNYRFNIRLELLLYLCDIYFSLNQLAVKKLQDIFDKSALFTNYPMVDVLLVLITKQSIEVLSELHKMLPIMQRLTSAKMTQEQMKQMSDVLSKMITYCFLENEPEERQCILNTVFDILSQEIDIRLMVFTGNKSTCLKVLPNQVQKIMQLVSSFSNKAPQFLDLLNAIVKGENRFIESICKTIFSVKELLEILRDAKISNNLKRPFVRFLLWVYLNTASGMIDSRAGDLMHDEQMWGFVNSLQEVMSSLTKFAENNQEKVKELLKKPPGKYEQGHEDLKSHGSLHYILDAALPFLLIFVRSFYQPDRENHPEEALYVDTLAQSLVDFNKVVVPLISNPTHLKSMVGCINVILSASTLEVNVMEDFQQTFEAKASMGNTFSDARKKYLASFQQEEELNGRLNVFAINYSATYGGYNDVKTQIGFDKIEKEYTKIGGDEELPLGQEFQDHLKCFIKQREKNIKKKYQMAGKLIQQLEISASANYLNEWDRLNQEQLDKKCLQLLRALVHNQIVQLPLDWEFDVRQNNKQLLVIQMVQNALHEHGAMLKILSHLSKTTDDIVREVLAFLTVMLFRGNQSVQESLSQYFLGTREKKFFFAIKSRMNLSAIATKEKSSLIAQHQAKNEETINQMKTLRKAIESGRQVEEVLAVNMAGSALQGQLHASRMSTDKKGHKRKTTTSNMLKMRYGRMSPMGCMLSLNNSKLQLEVSPMIQALTKPINMSKDHKKKNKKNKVTPLDDKSPEIVFQEYNDEELEEIATYMMKDDSLLDYKDEGYIELVLRMLGLMCDGQNKTLQNYLREQPDNIKSVNLIAETAQFLGLIYSSINNNTIDLVTEIFNTLVKFCSDNHANQVVVFDNKICDYINFILRSAQFQGCKLRDIVEFKKSIGALVTALIEENSDKDEETGAKTKSIGVAMEVTETIDADSIWQVAVESYIKTQSKDIIGRKVCEMKEFVQNVGFNFFHILKRVNDIKANSYVNKTKLLKSPLHEEVWNYYERGTLSIEILKDNNLQKIYFRCKDKTVLREDVKEKFKYEVDRSLPSNKLREFMDWSKDIMDDIKYMQKVRANPFSRYLVKFW
ncbi:hypothetical protein LSH36_505g01003 [Paralvinella palmiformis]|uniref:RyR/IP3R Homology associated domain-containing protein n=1 Tax=Paralvinella palmiformis TaxID=53620 RepID=A0AAD9MWR5_9ANNE|nr:hypothetical protein LSH36_505g01003 [Paralvinella palmiformis]